MKTTLLLIIAALFAGGAAAQPEPSAILTPEQKVFGLSKFWQEVNYNFVYFDRIDRLHASISKRAGILSGHYCESLNLCVRKLDGRAFVGIGVIPDVELPEPTLCELQAGNDLALERALELLRRQ